MIADYLRMMSEPAGSFSSAEGEPSFSMADVVVLPRASVSVVASDLRRIDAAFASLAAPTPMLGTSIAIDRDPDAPVTSWRAAADVLGVSEDTIARRRREHAPDARPWWSSADACRAWWAVLGRPKSRAGRPPKTSMR